MGDAALEAERARLKDVEAEIMILEHAIVMLRMERFTIQGRLHAYKYPVLTLPNEIVSEIFLHFLPPYPDCPSPTGRFSPTLLTQICRKWRQIALATPALWSAIPSPPLEAICDEKYVHLLESWLARSGLCPVSINIGDEPEDLQEGVLQALIPHRLRWEYLELGIYGTLIHRLEGPTPLLRRLNLWLEGSPASPVAFTEALLLRTASLNDYAAANVVLPWAQLTSLTLKVIYPSECTPVLLQTCGLVHCELFLLTDHPGVIQPDVSLPCLESLILVDEDSTGVTEYLGTFIVPALRKLRVPELFIGTDPISSLASFISKSGCKLEEVRITGERSVPRKLYRKVLPLVAQLTFAKPASAPESDEEESVDDSD
ncbi:hypothetical protein C8R43DRAFT_1065415 [Mycena crocata]|nr:hypothetical protein C8R43DRAFT_1065415 [Mycena crocata]